MVRADSVPKLFNLEEDFSERGVVCEKLDLTGAIEKDIVICRKYKIRFAYSRLFYRICTEAWECDGHDEPPSFFNPSVNQSIFSSTSSRAYRIPPFGPSASSAMIASRVTSSRTSRAELY